MKSTQIRKFALFLTFIGSMFPAIAQAQVIINMTRVTCADYLAMTPDQSRTFSAWMSGYFNQKSGYSWVDLSAEARNVANVKQWCTSNPGELVMNGLQRATEKQ